MTNSTATHRGQVLIIVALVMVVLLGIAALAVDLGFGWMMRRQAQNAVDPAAVAAARWIDDATGASLDARAHDAACFYAHQTGYFGGPDSTAACVPANDEHQSTLTVNFPPDATAGQWAAASGMVQVIITSQRATFFGRILGVPSMTVTEQAVAARQRGNTNSHSLIALNPSDCATGNVHGSGSVRIYPAPGYSGDGGYVQVNSDCGSARAGDDVCGPGGGALKIDGTAVLVAPKVNVHGSCQSASAPVGTLDEASAQIGDPLSGLVPPAFDPTQDGGKCGVTSLATRADTTVRQSCGSAKMPWKFSPDADCPGMAASFKCVVLQPGVYYGGWEINTKIHVRLNPGIYTIAGGGITIKSSGELDSIQSAGGSPAPVLIVNTDNPLATGCPSPKPGCQADLQLGTATSKLKIAGLLPNVPCPPVTTTGGCPFGRMVIWHVADGSQGYSGLIDIEGGGALSISGTIYAPTATVDIEGHAGTNCGTGPKHRRPAFRSLPGSGESADREACACRTTHRCSISSFSRDWSTSQDPAHPPRRAGEPGSPPRADRAHGELSGRRAGAPTRRATSSG